MKASLLVVLMASTAAADTLESGDVYLIRADGWAEPACEKWHVDADRQQMTHRNGQLRDTITFGATAIEIKFTSFEHSAGLAIGAEDVYANPKCNLTAELERVRGGYRVGTARWFSTKQACVAAFKKHERVGTTFGCPPPEDFPLFLTSYLKDFTKIMASGGTMFVGPSCAAHKFDSGIEHDEDAKIVKLCSTELMYVAKEDSIELGAVRLYFYKDRCKAHERARVKVASYLPVVASADGDATLPSCK